MAADSKCPRCEKTSFEAVQQTVRGITFEQHFIRCSACKTVVGVLDRNFTDAFLGEIHGLLDKVKDIVEDL